MDCLDSDYIRQMRYFHIDPRAASAASRLGGTTTNSSSQQQQQNGKQHLNGSTHSINNPNNRRTSNICSHSLNLLSIDEETVMLNQSYHALPNVATTASTTNGSIRKNTSLKSKPRNKSESGGDVAATQKKVLIASQSQISTAEVTTTKKSNLSFFYNCILKL